MGFIQALLSFFGKAKPAAPSPVKPPIVQPLPQTPPPSAQAAVEVAPQVEPVKPAPARGVGITVEHLTKMGATAANAAKYVDHLNETCARFEINTRSRICHFIAQIFEESGNLRVVRENLNYDAKACMRVWPKTFPTVESTVGFVKNPAALANKMYGGRLGNKEPGDGWKFSGRGLIQITFRGNYEPCGKVLGLDLVSHPELLEEARWAAMSAGWYWRDQGRCNALADIDTFEQVKVITKRVNGGYNNLASREKHWKQAKVVFADFK